MDIRLDILERSSCATRILGYSSDNPASLTLLEPTYVHTRALLLFSKHCWSALKRPVKCAMNVPYVPHHVKLQTQLYPAVRHYRVLACLYITSQHTTLFSLKTPFGVLHNGCYFTLEGSYARFSSRPRNYECFGEGLPDVHDGQHLCFAVVAKRQAAAL